MPRESRNKQKRPSEAHDLDYRPATPGDWSTVPKEVGSALDLIRPLVGGGGSGDVVGPGSSTTNAVALFASGTGKLLKNSEFLVVDGAGFDATFDISGITKARTLTHPNLAGVLVVVGGAQDLQAKGLQDATCYFYDDLTGNKLYFELTNLTANRIFTVPDAAGTLVLEALAQTLANKTLTTPTIGSFVNATHDHEDAAGGGTLSLGEVHIDLVAVHEEITF